MIALSDCLPHSLPGNPACLTDHLSDYTLGLGKRERHNLTSGQGLQSGSGGDEERINTVVFKRWGRDGTAAGFIE